MSLHVVLSPAKSLDFETPIRTRQKSFPVFVNESKTLIDILRCKSDQEISELMGISSDLTSLNTARYKAWKTDCSIKNSRQALLAFNGDVYDGLDAKSLNEEVIRFAQKHIFILSGLYGVLKPMDLIQPYRLEMGVALVNPRGSNLYAYWKSLVTKFLNENFKNKHSVLINLASDEYFKSVDLKSLNCKVIKPVFQDHLNDQYKVIGFYAKKARGWMARYIIDHRVQDCEQLKSFTCSGYVYEPELSTNETWIFRRNLHQRHT